MEHKSGSIRVKGEIFMQMNSVPTLSIAGMVFSLVIAIVLPIALCIFVRCKTKAKISSFFYGCAVFFVFALILEQILHTIVFMVFGTGITENILLYGLYGGVAAALFEETGRFVAMKFLMKKQLTRENGLMYGVGHGGLEAILIVGLAYISNIVTAFMINSNQMEAALSPLSESQRESTIQSLSALWTTSSDQFFAAGIERISAIILQIALSILVYKAVKSGQKKFWALAMGVHFLVDFIAVISSQKLSIWFTEVLIFIITMIVAVLAFRIYKEDGADNKDCA